MPLYWDLQGADTPEELGATFGDAVLDAAETLSRLGLDPDRLADLDLDSAAERLRTGLVSRGRTLLLLGDEAEELVTLGLRHGELLGELGRLLAGDGVRAVLVASVRLAALADRGGEVAGLLELLSPPRYLPPLGDFDAAALVRQEQLRAAARPGLSAPQVETICGLCGNHPFLLQLLGKRVLESGEVERAADELHHDRVLHHLFTVDLGLLAPEERGLLAALARGEAAGGSAARLTSLGLVRPGPDGGLRVGNEFLKRWLASTSPDPHATLT